MHFDCFFIRAPFAPSLRLLLPPCAAKLSAFMLPAQDGGDGAYGNEILVKEELLEESQEKYEGLYGSYPGVGGTAPRR